MTVLVWKFEPFLIIYYFLGVKLLFAFAEHNKNANVIASTNYIMLPSDDKVFPTSSLFFFMMKVY